VNLNRHLYPADFSVYLFNLKGLSLYLNEEKNNSLLPREKSKQKYKKILNSLKFFFLKFFF